jgi:heterodisulfide reductase subunit B
MTLCRSEIVTKLSSRLIDAADEAGANVVAAACGICQINLDTRQKAQVELPALYFTELMGLAFGIEGVGKWLAKHSVDPRPLLRKLGLLD